MKNRLLVLLLGLAVFLVTAPAVLLGAGQPLSSLEQKVRHELITLPFYDVFDNLSFQVDGAKVTLLGEASRPSLKLDAERAVQGIEGVAAVDNRIEVLPTSFFDDRIRFAVLRAVYGSSTLFRYNLGPVAPIRIIVKNGSVTLEGAVSSEMDRNVANLAANGVPGVFSVTNNLRVAKI